MKHRLIVKILIVLAATGAVYAGVSLYVNHSIRTFYFGR